MNHALGDANRVIDDTNHALDDRNHALANANHALDEANHATDDTNHAIDNANHATRDADHRARHSNQGGADLNKQPPHRHQQTPSAHLPVIHPQSRHTLNEEETMKAAQGNTLTALEGIQTFLDTHADALPGAVKSDIRKQLDGSIAVLSGHATDQKWGINSAQGATQKHKSARSVLMRDHMAPISRIAHLELPALPEFVALRMPRGNPSVPRLVAAARAMGKEAASHADVFVAAGLPADFVAQLDAAILATLEPVSVRKQSRGTARGATVGLTTQLTTARRIVKVIDAFVRTALKDNAPLLATWNSVKHATKTRVTSVSAPVVAMPASANPTPALPAAVPAPAAAA